MGLDYDLQKTLEWCAENEVDFRVTNETGKVAITAKRDNIFAEYFIDEPFDAAKLGNSVWASLFAVKHGTQFHQRYGHYPPVGGGSSANAEEGSGAGITNGSNPNDSGSAAPDASPDILPTSVPRRGPVGGSS